ncbi:hypothetical protein [Spiroplasma sp. DGKH1]|uniref:hypothetical protein n=1 Tax=Spiroplasma sp. DGKH1 TaxID=3050074 RepID=UPI0034C69DB2
MNFEIEKFQKFYQDFKNNFNSFLDLAPKFTNFFMLLDNINNYWLEYKTLIQQQEIATASFINLILNYDNNETTNEKIKEFLVQEIKINKLAELIIDNLNKFVNNSQLLDVINNLVNQKYFINNKFTLIYYLEDPVVLAEIENNKNNYLLLKNRYKIIEVGGKLQIFNQQLAELKDNIIFNFYLFKRHKNYDYRFADDINRLDILLFEQYKHPQKQWENLNKYLKKTKYYFEVKFLLLFFLNNFMVNIWKENSLLLKNNQLEINQQEQEDLSRILNFLLLMIENPPKDQELITQFKDIVLFYKNRIFDEQKILLFLNNKKESPPILNLIKDAEVFPAVFLNFVINNITKIIELATFKICFSHWPKALVNKSQLINRGYLSFMKDINKIKAEKKVFDKQLVEYARKLIILFEDTIVNGQKDNNFNIIINNPRQDFIQKLKNHDPNLLPEFAKIINTFSNNSLDNVNVVNLPRKKNDIKIKKNQNQQHQEKLTNDKIALEPIILAIK